MKKFFLLLVLAVICFSCNGSSENAVCELTVEKEIELEVSPELAIWNVQDITIRDESIILSETYMNKCNVYEFNFDGKFVRKIGANGQGPGEYLDTGYLTTDNQGNTIICDNDNGRINRYDRSGVFVKDISAQLKIENTKKIEFLQDERILHFGSYAGRDKLTMYNTKDDAIDWSLDPTSSNYSVVNLQLSSKGRSSFVYNPHSSLVYCIPPCDYRMKVFDASTGGLEREFGEKPDGFRSLDSKYHSVNEIGTVKILSSIIDNTTFVIPTAFQLVNQKYLFVGYTNRINKICQAEWQLYDLSNSEKLVMMANDSLLLENYRFTVKDEFLVAYVPSDDGGNGLIRFYKIIQK